MNPVGTSSVAFVTLSGLFWGGWLIGSQTPQGQEALARAYAMYTADAQAEADLFAPDALRALVCGVDAGPNKAEIKPCLAVAAAGRLFLVDAGSGAAMALDHKSVALDRLEAVLLTGADPVRAADLDELWVSSSPVRGARTLPVYGPADSYPLVEGLNLALSARGSKAGLEAWAPAPEPDAPVIVFEADGLTVVAFTTQEDAHEGRVGYRFDYRGRSLVVAGDGRAEWSDAAGNADVVLHGAKSEMLAELHTRDAAPHSLFDMRRFTQGPGNLVLTETDPNPVMAQLQRREAQLSKGNVLGGKPGMVVELPLTSRDVRVRPL
jgi:ribonuclease Z